MRVSNAKLGTYRRCPKRFEFKYVHKLRPKARSIALERGSWIHKLLMVHNDGEDWRSEHAKLTKEFNNLWEEVREELGDLPAECGRIMRSYLRTYKLDADRYRVVDTELDEIITLPNGLELQIIIDCIIEDTVDGGLWIKDYKTRKSFSDSSSMMMDPQLTLYFWGCEYLGYKPIRGVVYDEIRTKPPTIPEVLKSGALTQRKNIDTDVYTYMSTIRAHRLDPVDYEEILRHIATNQKDRFFRRTFLPKDGPVVRAVMQEAVWTAQDIQRAERTQHFPRTYDHSCSYSCDYKDLCLIELMGGDIQPIVKMNFERSRRGND